MTYAYILSDPRADKPAPMITSEVIAQHVERARALRAATIRDFFVTVVHACGLALRRADRSRPRATMAPSLGSGASAPY